MTKTDAVFGWVIVGPGSIARRFVLALRSQSTPARVVAVCGRDEQTAASFADRLGLRHAFVTANLAEALSAEGVDGVYVATPHSAHRFIVEQSLRARKAVLCEKPMTTNPVDTAQLIDQARTSGAFLMEALWTRFLPVYAAVQQWLQLGRIGYVRSVASTFCFPMQPDPDSRLLNPKLGGGVLLDIGIYNLAMTRWVMTQAYGAVPRVIDRRACSTLTPLGVDISVSGSMRFANQVTAQFLCAFDRYADNSLVIHGSDGAIEVPHGFWGAEKAVLRRPGDADVVVTLPHDSDGLEHEIAEVMRCVRAGAVESSNMSLHESLELSLEIDQWIALARDSAVSDGTDGQSNQHVNHEQT
jgi:predicted dehydrogenase